MFVDQVREAIDIFEKYPDCSFQIMTAKKPPKPYKMNVSNGGKQPYMRDTEQNGCVQMMTPDDGTQRGMKAALEKRGMDETKMKADQMQELKK